jgi:hypothetical protein
MEEMTLNNYQYSVDYKINNNMHWELENEAPTFYGESEQLPQGVTFKVGVQ